MIVRYRLRLYIMTLLILGGFSAVAARLWHIQIEKHDYYTKKVPGTSTVTVRLPGIRGEIKDRNGITLVENVHSYQVLFNLKEILDAYKETHETVPKFEHTFKAGGFDRKREETDMVAIVKESVLPALERLGLAKDFNGEDLQLHWRSNEGLIPYSYATDLTFDEFATFAENSLDLPGVTVAVKPKRRYVYDSLACHILGFVREPDIKTVPEDTRKEFDFYVPDDYGGDGIEKTMNAELQGLAGKRTLLKNEKGRIVEELDEDYEAPIAGSDIYLTIDARIQFIVERALRSANDGKGIGRGAVVVLDPSNGDVLAMASVPSFNPNKFIPTIAPEDWEAYLANEVNPLINRALKDYAPGSTFKIPVSFAGFLSDTYNRSFHCAGGVSYGPKTYMQCWIGAKGGAHGSLPLHAAIMRSCNCFFYQYGNVAGIANIEMACKMFGLGMRSGVKLLDEDTGRVPNPRWQRMQGLGGWGEAQTALVAIGQGATEATPLQMASVAATVGSKGMNYQPKLIHKKIVRSKKYPDGRPEPVLPVLRYNLQQEGIPAEKIEIVRAGMYEVVNVGGGTARRAQSKLAVISGKTGTAQFLRSGEPDNHAWFISFAPYENPKYAVCVFVQGGKAGGVVGAPIARKVIEESLAMEKGYKFELEPVPEVEGNFDFVQLVSFDDSPANEFIDDANEDDGSAVAARPSIPLVASSRHKTRAPSMAKKPDARGTTSKKTRKVSRSKPGTEKKRFRLFKRKR